MNNSFGVAINLINLMFKLGYSVMFGLLVLSIFTFVIEPFRGLYAMLARADYEQATDVKFFIKHCLRLSLCMIAFILLRINPIAELIVVLLREVTEI